MCVALCTLQPTSHLGVEAHKQGCCCRYDPYARVLLREGYDHEGMREARRAAISKASLLETLPAAMLDLVRSLPEQG